jgi:hypothetical protein
MGGRKPVVLASRMPFRRIESIFRRYEFSEASANALAHALKIRLVSHSKLNMLHVAAVGPTRQ